MKKAIAMLLVIAMTAALAIGGTLAYLTDTDEDVNVMTLGQVKIDQLEYERVDVETENEDADVQEFHDNKPLLPAVTDKGFDYTPGDTYVDWDQIGKDGYTSDIWDPEKINNEVDKMVFVKNKGDWDAYVRTVFGFEANGFTEAQFKELFHLNLNDQDYIWEWNGIQDINGTNYFIVTATYKDVLAPGAITPISLSQIALDSKATNETVAGFGDTFQILVQSQAVQAAGFSDAETALNEAFGDIPNEDGEYPFENDSPTKGIGLKQALHYYEGNGSKITTKVSNVLFGLNADNAGIVDKYEGTLVDVEQDVPVYAYYVPNGSNYDIYFLSGDVIYTPVNSADLFNGMSNLVSVDTSNLDVSRTEDMTMMFMGCTKLSDIDLSRWDTSKVTSLFATFANCKALTAPAMDNWDTSNVTTMRALFSGAGALNDLDVSNWDTSKVTAMNNMFYGCSKLTELPGIGNFDTSKVLDMGQMFCGCTGLTALDVANWDTGSVQYFRGTFRGCTGLTELDVSKWDVSGVLEFNSMFSGDGSTMNLTKIDVSNWNPISCTSTAYMFYGCGNITSMDLSKWNVPKLGNMYHMFTDCGKLASVDFGVWETDVLWSVDGMFNDCWSLKSVDMSTFNVSNVTEFSQLFEGCSSLETIIGLENWNTSKGQTFEEMFDGCKSLKELDLSGFDTRSSNVNFKSQVNGANMFLYQFINGCTSLEKITFGPYFSFDGDGTAPDGYKFVMPSAAVEGWDGKWYNAATGVGYLPSEIPEETAATYVAVKP